MAWFRRTRKIAPRALAESLHEVFVQEREQDEAPDQFEIPQNLVAKFRSKMTLYREAVILMTLLSASRKRSEYGEVLSEFEDLVLGPRSTPVGLEKLGTLKAAMADLGNLIYPPGQPAELTWSSEWLKDIGHIDHNPARTAQFALVWTGEYSAMERSIKGFRIDRRA